MKIAPDHSTTLSSFAAPEGLDSALFNTKMKLYGLGCSDTFILYHNFVAGKNCSQCTVGTKVIKFQMELWIFWS